MGGRTVGINIVNTNKHVKHVLVRTMRSGSRATLGTTVRHRNSDLINTSTNRITTVNHLSMRVISSLGAIVGSVSILVSFDLPSTARRGVRVYTTRGITVIVNAAKFGRRRRGILTGTDRRITVICTNGCSANIGLSLGLLNVTTGTFNASTSMRIVRTRRGRGVSTPSNATCVVTRTITRTHKRGLGSITICNHRKRANRHRTNDVNVRTVQNNRVVNSRAIVFVTSNRIIRVARHTHTHVAFTTNTMHTTA